ncbi:branched-chain amino acid ABC transporter permease [Herbaspirillum sp. BH-1]|uniref:Branched-subunit amino acid permease n=1 Tax=Herbaspirillum frisingense TaxID=92645 RepID=A0ABU1PCF6_9BURK|nr:MULTISPECIES: AzlC family ABC transporter permease [Herbaspirillum]MDR6583612.1 putative branched-subunit amino acid permease [Herbaspirillum frisingense]PLY57571.1 branched-chain amino acid ABC transporter permease [Herbaspirillum sp. BH-1]
MKLGTYLSEEMRRVVLRSLLRTLPTALTVVPIAMLCGVLASQSGWGLIDTLLFSAFGFSGSGQLALLPLAEQGIGFLTMLLMAASINSRYIPIAFATAHRLPSGKISRALMAHILGDEAYVVEKENDTMLSVMVIRLTIYVVWVLASVSGALLFGFIPSEWMDAGINLSFPAGLVLFVLSLRQIKSRLPQVSIWGRRCFVEITLCVLVAICLLALLGKIWFWLPGIAFCTWRMKELADEFHVS